ncbi:hypothetical protein [Dokdonella sp.]|uniref:hypothetical protein n=1 Tax=Dokdonella sp. TaxID=2291710 RepID=UPI0031C5B36C|nr:hypothetical protein [Dokdonella sp.]
MSTASIIIALYAIAGLCAVLALAQLFAVRRRWRERRRLSAGHRALWSAVFVLLAGLAGLGGLTLTGWHRLTSEALLAHIDTHQLAPQRFAVVVTTPDGTRREIELRGDEWQLDARVIKWQPWAVALGAPPLYRLDRISGRFRDVASEAAQPRSVAALADQPALDAWQLKQRFPRWLPWIDADYGSAAYLPMVDDGHFSVTLAAGGGLVARAADAATQARMQAAGW